MLNNIAAVYDNIQAPGSISPDLIKNIITYLMIGVGIVAVVIILYAAFLMVTANGEPDKFKNGRQALTAGIIGLAIAVLGGVIVQIIMSSLGG